MQSADSPLAANAQLMRKGPVHPVLQPDHLVITLLASMFSIKQGTRFMANNDEDYVYDEESGEWMPASELAAKQAAADQVEVRDAVGNLLSDGDQVTLIKDLEVKGAGQTLKQGTLIKSIRLTGDAQEIDCKYPGIKGLVLRAEFVRKR
jgi:protein PhnA